MDMPAPTISKNAEFHSERLNSPAIVMALGSFAMAISIPNDTTINRMAMAVRTINSDMSLTVKPPSVSN